MTESKANSSLQRKITMTNPNKPIPNKPFPQEFVDCIERTVAEMLRRNPDKQKH